MNKIVADVLVLGEGLAGMTAALTAAQAGSRVCIAGKGGSASPFVIGFSAPVGEDDSPEQFVEDMMTAGCGLNDRELALAFARRAMDIPQWMEALDAPYENTDGKPELMRSLGHTRARLVHQGTKTGPLCMEKLVPLLEESKVQTLHPYACMTLLKDGDRVNGAVLMNLETNGLIYVQCSAVVLCTGGCHIARRSTYPEQLTGDGYSLAYKAGATLTDMEFIQHEPLRCADKRIGMSTTMLDKGGMLLNAEDDRFVLRSYPSEGSPTKDELSRLIAVENLEGRGSPQGGAYVDLTKAPQKTVDQHQAIYERFLNNDLDLTKVRVEVKPAAHSIMGGVRIDENGFTGIKGLYAAGEVTGGMHGASRLGGNAGSETVVMGCTAGREAAAYAASVPLTSCAVEANAFEKWMHTCLKKPCYIPTVSIIRHRVLEAMEQGMGPARTQEGITKTLDQLDTMSRALGDSGVSHIGQFASYMAVSHLLLTCRVACLGALNRKESCGSHYRVDYPEKPVTPQHFDFQKQSGMTIRQE